MSVRKRTLKAERALRWSSSMGSTLEIHKFFIKKILLMTAPSAISVVNQTRHASGGASASYCAPRRVLSFPAVGMPV